jgi:hypothetical protein
MGSSTYRRIEKNSDIEKLEKSIGKDGLKENTDNFNLGVYPEFVPTLNSWISPEEQKKRVQEISENLE